MVFFYLTMHQTKNVNHFCLILVFKISTLHCTHYTLLATTPSKMVKAIKQSSTPKKGLSPIAKNSIVSSPTRNNPDRINNVNAFSSQVNGVFVSRIFKSGNNTKASFIRLIVKSFRDVLLSDEYSTPFGVVGFL